MASGKKIETILEDYPELEEEDVKQSLEYAAKNDMIVLTADLDFGDILVIDDYRIRIRELPVL
ncbi:MAG: DUF433 domain-containing protein [Pseudomonadota bacterium]|nr:DUF433 domain-containing protein [Pseudomonadota bacterium]